MTVQLARDNYFLMSLSSARVDTPSAFHCTLNSLNGVSYRKEISGRFTYFYSDLT